MLKRISVPSMDAIMGNEIPVLDKGFIRLVDYMGDDSSIVQAARVSFNQGTKTPEKDRSLIRFLMQNRHTSPFEMCEIKLHIKMPIFIARQWVRHRTASINEISARYTKVQDDFYVPDEENVCTQSKSNFQCRGDSVADSQVSQNFIHKLEKCSLDAHEQYNEFLTDGIAREISRCILPINQYTEIYWKVDLHNLMHFLKLRTSSGAQWEMREYANVILEQILKIWLPNTYEGFNDFILNSITITNYERAIIKQIMSKPKAEIDLLDSRLSNIKKILVD